ncbi:MAG: hypothetical protein AVDCRST_MAG69-466, partial [uncultured Solirubrobacteraceae bacterium]
CSAPPPPCSHWASAGAATWWVPWPSPTSRGRPGSALASAESPGSAGRSIPYRGRAAWRSCRGRSRSTTSSPSPGRPPRDRAASRSRKRTWPASSMSPPCWSIRTAGRAPSRPGWMWPPTPWTATSSRWSTSAATCSRTGTSPAWPARCAIRSCSPPPLTCAIRPSACCSAPPATGSSRPARCSSGSPRRRPRAACSAPTAWRP